MKKLILIAAVGTVLAAVIGPALAGASSASVKTVTVVMKDPGCHWFATAGGKTVTTLTVKGPVKLANYDEAALKVAGPKGTKLEKVGGRLLLVKGLYRITMVGQAPDDNHLKLTVR